MTAFARASPTSPHQTAPRGDFADFYRATYSDLASYAWSLTRDAGIGEELAQEAMTRVYARWPVLREPRPYAYRVTTNLVRDRWQRQAKERDLLQDLMPDPDTPGPDSGTLDAVRRLSPALREAVLLHYFADLSVEDVARVLRRPVGSIKRRLFDARTALATALREDPR